MGELAVKQTSTTTAQEQWARYVRARDSGHAKYVESAKKFDRFFRGIQWDDRDKARLDAEGKPALTINEILPIVNAVLGEQAARRASVRFRSKRNGNPQTADALTKLTMQVLEDNEFHYLESEVFADGLIQERGFYDIRMNFDENMLGDIEITGLDPLDVIIDPDAKDYNPDKWTEVFITRWMSLDEIEKLYGLEAAKKIQASVAGGQHNGNDSVRFHSESFFGETHNRYADETLLADAEEKRGIRCVRVIERQYYRYVKVWHFVDMVKGDIRKVPETWDAEKRIAFATMNGLGMVERAARRVRWTVSADQTLLHDDWSPYDSFTVVPYFCYFRRGNPIGMVTNLVSPQEQKNKVSSQELHIVNTTANSGWIVEEGSLTNLTPDELREQGAQTGLVLVTAPNRKDPQKIQPNQIPTGLDRISMKASDEMRAISGINGGMLGEEGGEVSGVALRNKERRGQVQIKKPLDNLARTRRLVALKILELVQQFYTEQRVIQITNEWQPGEPTEELVVNQLDISGQVLNDLTRGRYTCVVTDIPNHQTFDDLMFAQAISLREIGINIPGHHVVKHSHLPNRDQIALEVQQLEGLAPPSPEEQEMMALKQQLEVRAMTAEVEKLEIEVSEIESQIRLNMAKAESLDADAQLEVAKLMAQLEQKRFEMATRKRLAELSAQTQLTKQQMNNDTRLIGDAMNRIAQQTTPKQEGASK